MVAKGASIVKTMQAKALNEQRVERPITDLILSAHCGGSDWTSGLSANPVTGGVLDIHEAIGGTVVVGFRPRQPDHPVRPARKFWSR